MGLFSAWNMIRVCELVSISKIPFVKKSTNQIHQFVEIA